MRRSTVLEVSVEAAMTRFFTLRKALSGIAAADGATPERLREMAKQALDHDDEEEEL